MKSFLSLINSSVKVTGVNTFVPTIPTTRGFHSCKSLWAGHSKWHNIRHKKAKNDLSRANQFTKISREITISVKLGGLDLDHNIRLVSAISKAKDLGFPKDGIENAIAKGSSASATTNLSDITYEGYGPNGVAIMITMLTPSTNRTAQFVRNTLAKHGGNMGNSGTVAWMFENKGIIAFNRNKKSDEELMEIALEAGADDIQYDAGETGEVQVVCDRNKLLNVKRELEKQGFVCSKSEVVHIPNSTVSGIVGEEKDNLEKLIDTLEEYEDTQSVVHNWSETEEEQ